MRLGYSFWGFLGDYKEDVQGNYLSSPDGNSTYAWSILWEAQQRGWETFLMQVDRDAPAVMRRRGENFSAFCQDKRIEAYMNAMPTHGHALPDLDVLLIEWRFPIHGRNCEMFNGFPSFKGNLHPDLFRQNWILRHYEDKGTKIIVWDLDHKLTKEDEQEYRMDAIFETSVTPRRLTKERVRAEPPTVIADLLEHPTLLPDPKKKLVYVGSRYERDDVIQQYLEPVSRKWPGEIQFWGNWTNEPNLSQCKEMWPHFSYNGRITTKDFRKVYGDAVACPLLAKRSYLETGFITPRPWEALMFGTIPIGISEAKGIHDYVLFAADSADDFAGATEYIMGLPLSDREKVRKENLEKIQFMDVSHFINKIEKVLS